jgi:hypothetical protein
MTRSMGHHGVKEGLGWVARMKRQPHQPALAALGCVERGDRVGLELAARDQANTPGPFADQGIAVGQKDKRPWCLQPLDPGGHAHPGHLGARRVGEGLRLWADERVGQSTGCQQEEDGEKGTHGGLRVGLRM